MKIQTFIFNWRGQYEKTKEKQKQLSAIGVVPVVINSDDNHREDDPNWHNIGEDSYFTAQFLKAIELFDKDDESVKYYSDDNYEFLSESGLLKKITIDDYILRPYMGCNRIYDVLTGSLDGYTPLRYEVNDRNYFMVVNGYIDVILIPPKYSKYLRFTI
jgi:hypothetical protein